MSEEAALFELLTLDCRVDADGTVRYFNALGQLHREYGPAVKYVDGTLVWYQHGQLHRLGGPAVVNADGSKFWYRHGLRHRIAGPAVEYEDSTHMWYQNGQLHRLDGPALVDADGVCDWYINGKELAQAEWEWLRQVASMETI